MIKVVACEDGYQRCAWSGATKEYIRYHDEEWGHPTKNDRTLFEKMSLEGFQSGLSWLTILNKRDNFRQAFKNFDFNQISKFDQKDIDELLKNKGIVRHKGKIEAVINNACLVQDIIDEKGSLAAYFWGFEPKHKGNADELVSTTAESIALSKDLKKRGFKFVGPTTMYALMQAMGLVNDHSKQCFMHAIIERNRAQFARP